MQNPLSERHQNALKAAARSTDDPAFFNANEALDRVIAKIKAEVPEAFLTKADLKNRRFVYAPADPEGRDHTPFQSAMRYTPSAHERATHKRQKATA